MHYVFTGIAHVYMRGDINTDEIIPARRMISHDERELAKYAMEDLDQNFISKVQFGDFLIAGHNFGCGSSREHAIWALRGAGIRLVIAKSFARIFLRNAINNGFFAIECSQADQITDGDELEIDLKNGNINIINRQELINFHQIPDFVLHIANKGGLLKTLS